MKKRKKKLEDQATKILEEHSDEIKAIMQRHILLPNSWIDGEPIQIGDSIIIIE